MPWYAAITEDGEIRVIFSATSDGEAIGILSDNCPENGWVTDDHPEPLETLVEFDEATRE